MNSDHEYVLLDGVNRASIGRYLAIAASGISAVLVSALIFLVNWWESLGHPQFPQVLAVPITAGFVYLALYALFKNYIWKWQRMQGVLKVPDLSGRWKCRGVSLNPKDGVTPDWTGVVSITQDWDVIRIQLETSSSMSNSIAAALQYDVLNGYHLLYTYKNEVKADSPRDMVGHRGAAHLTFSKDLKSCEGDYFNGRGRYTFGTMRLSKIDE